ncbi:hypothetical protein BGX34_000609 [Mortierella sp. NVP85]|nr:hypothetical protein BGX34_000609 [Mortierella sp. NVP85]
MTKDDRSFESSVLKYMMQDFTRLSVHERTCTPSKSQLGPEVSSYRESTSANAQLGIANQVPNYGTSSLFLTDYEQHNWLEYGERCMASQKPEHDNNQDPRALNETNSNFSVLKHATPLISSSNNFKFERQCLDSGFTPWNLDVQEEGIRSVIRTKTTTPLGFSITPQVQIIQPSSERGDSIFMTSEGARGETAIGKGRFADTLQGRHQLASQATPQSPSPSFGTFLDDHDILTGPMSNMTISGDYSCDLSFSGCSGTPTRYLKVSNVARDVPIWSIQNALKSYGDLKRIFTSYLESDSTIILEFFDIRHAVAASRQVYSIAASDPTGVHAQFWPNTFMSQISPDILNDGNDGVLVVSWNIVSLYGDVRSFQMESDQWPLTILVEYYDTRCAARAKAVLEDMYNKNQVYCQVSFYQASKAAVAEGNRQHPSIRDNSAKANTSMSLERLASSSGWPHSETKLVETVFPRSFSSTVSGELASQRKASVAHFQPLRNTNIFQSPPMEEYSGISLNKVLHPSPIGESSREINGHESAVAPKPVHDMFTTSETSIYTSATTSSTDTSPASNRDIPYEKDLRTTFMIRHIPNKYTQEMILEWINETHFGKFDFLYLRMDFKNRCNVGYAFINFTDTDAAMAFKKEHVGRKWSRFNSDKKCELAYAAIQGRHALIERFRNSSVMNQEPSYRPKIFYTSGPNIGKEEPFPEPTVRRAGPSSTTRHRPPNTRHGVDQNDKNTSRNLISG